MPETEISDALLVVRCQTGDQEAWELLVRRWHPRLWRFVSNMISDAVVAEDILQTVWLRTVKSMFQLQQPERLPAWLFRVARTVVADHLRDRYRQPVTTHVNEIAEWETADQQIDVVEEIELGLERLHPNDREVVVLHYLEGMSVAEVAEICHVPSGTVKSRLSRARQILRERLSS